MDEETLFKTVYIAQKLGRFQVSCATDAGQASSEADSAWDQLQEFRGTEEDATWPGTYVPDVATEEAETLDLDRRLRPGVDPA